MLTDRRDVLVGQRTAAINRVRWWVHELDPEQIPGALDAAKHQRNLACWLSTQSGLVAELAAEELAGIIALSARITALAGRMACGASVAPIC